MARRPANHFRIVVLHADRHSTNCRYAEIMRDVKQANFKPIVYQVTKGFRCFSRAMSTKCELRYRHLTVPHVKKSIPFEDFENSMQDGFFHSSSDCASIR